MNVYEMEGFLRGKCLPGDLLVGESHAAYLVRKLSEASALKADRDAQQKLADALAVENAALKEMNSSLCSELQEYESDNDDFGPAPQSVVNCFALLTPNTDTALSAMQKQAELEAVEMFAERMLTMANDPAFGTGSYRNDLRTAGARARAYLSVLREAK
ncbi:Uncharacterised protein [Serratia grimesii]|uniref:hypothetical protein n=1 Tax=Serratia grimesii TaxID=82995 RepID=UPI00217762AA|nr:hypothetical protein [Serratia grimesii]CAI1502208.1 Uncharacterised protein [Serratia grimesii]